jgi:hypothetical protein
VLFGVMFLAMIMFATARSGPVPIGSCALLLAPPVLGILSIGVWSERRKSRQ